jgi:organic radical activating enzyme
MSEYLSNIKTKLDETGCGFCAAKWTQVTIHLDKGMTHSCHHPSPHKIPLRELAKNPTALHNTRHKKQVRKQMLEGKRPAECDYCWKIEDTSNSFSDRTLKSSESWSAPYIEEIKELGWRGDYNPKYVEVSFSNTCNFKCAYCGPQYSSKWVQEINKHGPYKLSIDYNEIEELKKTNQMPIPHDEYNPYIEAFWKWWPDLYKDLHTFRITGGEPLLSKDTFKLLEYIQSNHTQNSNLSLAINTNLGASDDVIDKFIEIIKDLTENNKVRELIIFTSVEATGKQAEYSRRGLDYDVLWKNIDKILSQLPKVTINLMAAFNTLSVFTYGDLIDRVFEYKKKYHNNQRYWAESLQLDTSYVRWPKHLSIKILEAEHKEYILDAAKKAMYYGMKDTPMTTYGFSDIQIQKIKRAYDYAISEDGFDVEKYRTDFANFITEFDKRSDSNFAETFPELNQMYVKYKK